MGVTVADKTTNNESKKNSERIKHIFYTFFTCGLGKMINGGREQRRERELILASLLLPSPPFFFVAQRKRTSLSVEWSALVGCIRLVTAGELMGDV